MGYTIKQTLPQLWSSSLTSNLERGLLSFFLQVNAEVLFAFRGGSHVDCAFKML